MTALTWLELAIFPLCGLALWVGFYLGQWTLSTQPTSPADLESMAHGLRDAGLCSRAAELYARAAVQFEMQANHRNAETCWLLASRCSVDARNECLMRRGVA